MNMQQTLQVVGVLIGISGALFLLRFIMNSTRLRLMAQRQQRQQVSGASVSARKPQVETSTPVMPAEGVTGVFRVPTKDKKP